MAHVSSDDTLATQGLRRQSPSARHCIDKLPSGIKQLLLSLEALLLDNRVDSLDPLHHDFKGMLRIRMFAPR